MKRILLIVLGWVFLLLGIAGLFLPILQGILFILIGLSILATEYHWARRWIAHLGRRFPAVDGKVKKLLGEKAKYIPGYQPPAAGD
jgi:uncharacterized membrane protein YbaN (DUF454 family)